jgi:hypothetical protein
VAGLPGAGDEAVGVTHAELAQVWKASSVIDHAPPGVAAICHAVLAGISTV